MFARIAEYLQLHGNVLIVLAGVWLTLFLGSLVRWAATSFQPRERREQRLASLETWWVLWFLFSTAVLLGRAGGGLFFAVASCLGLREFLRLAVPDPQDRRLLTPAYLAIPLQYVLVFEGWLTAAGLLLPLVFLLAFPLQFLSRDDPAGFTRRVAVAYWGVMLTVYCLSHGPLLLSLPLPSNPVGGPAGWFLYLVLLTETCDIAQALWGRLCGRHRIVPTVSPHKTWQGLVLGVLTTIGVAVAVAPWLTPLRNWPPGVAAAYAAHVPFLPAAASGLLIAIAGFCGDINMSAIKRDAGVKDSSHLLPGQGGILDRIDSLTFAAPVFFYFVYALYV